MLTPVDLDGLSPMLLLERLESLSTPLLFVATLICGIVIGLAALLAVRAILRALQIDSTHVLPIRDALIGSLSNIFALMVAFSAAGIWNDAIQARGAVQREANALENIAALSTSLPEALRIEVRGEIQSIGRRAIEKDWPAMKRRVDTNEALLERTNSPVLHLITRISQEAGSLPAPQMTNLLLQQLIDLRSARLQREMIARGGVSPAQWAALVIIPIIALILILLAYPSNVRWQIVAGGAYVIGVSVALFVVLAHDRPFGGHLGIQPAPIEQAMQRLKGIFSGDTFAPTTLPAGQNR
jgi:hypothetical protein